uniref:Uncharacterized protein n=1 Tax=Anguilla anguilla TaxID=7936 RepID=A0A0E9XHS9_ANGAN
MVTRVIYSENWVVQGWCLLYLSVTGHSFPSNK